MLPPAIFYYKKWAALFIHPANTPSSFLRFKVFFPTPLNKKRLNHRNILALPAFLYFVCSA